MRLKCVMPSDLVMFACLVSLATLTSRRRGGGVLCQGHFKPMLHPPHAQPPLFARNVYAQHGAEAATRQQVAHRRPLVVPNRGLMGSLGGRSQSYLNQMVQQHQMRIQQQQRHVPPMSDRRASAPSSSSAANQLLFSSMPAAAAASQQVPFSGKPKTQEAAANNNSEQGKLLICYYTTKQTAPYWPRDAREFVVPADRLNQIVSSFSQQQPHSTAFGAAAERFSPREPADGGQQQQQRHSNLLSLDASNDDVRQHNQAAAHTSKHNQAQQINSFAGGRMIVVAPKFVPFNRTTSGNGIQNEPATELSPSSLAQMFFMPNNNEHQRHHNTIANRQDNAASFTTTSATNQPPPGQQSMVPQMADLIVANNNNLGGSGGIVFGKTPRGGKQHDLNGEERNSNNMIDAGGPTVNNQQAPPSSHIKTNLAQQQAVFVGNQNNNGGGQPSQRPNANNQRQLEQMKDQQQQLIYSASSSQPSMSRTFIVGASLAAPLVTGHALDSGQGSDQFGLGQTVPLMNNGDYYYYYNQPQSGSGSPPPGGAGGSTAATTLSLATTPYQPLLTQQQRSKSLQVAESEISPGPPTSSLQPSITFVESPSGVPPTYSLHSQTTLDRLIVSDRPPSTTTVRHLQQYSSGPSSQTTSFASTSDLLKPSAVAAAATGDDGMISSGTKTTPIASVASPSSASSSSSPSVASQQQQQQQHQLVATLPSSLLISYPPPPTSIAPPPPNGSSTAAAASLTKSAQTSNVGSAPNFDADTAATAAATTNNGNNRHHHHQHNNRQIVGVGGNSLSATLVSSPLSTMFDVFGAASQYLMRFKPSSLISPSSFASLNSIVGDSSSSSSGHHHNSRSNSSSSSPLISLPFASGILGAASSGLHGHKSNTSSDTGFLSRLSLQTHQRREDICGRTIQTPEKRIIGGEGAKYGEFPYQVHIKIAKHQCGGALIDKQSIVTAAHCVYHFITRAPVSKLQIVIGAYDIEDEQYQELPPQYFKVNRVKLHPNFRFSASHPDRYDIAILKLDKPVKYTDNVLPVCLPGKDLKYENMVGTVTGFGKTDPSLSNRYGTRLLQKVDVPIIENGECERWHRTRGIDLKIFPEMMCAGYEDGLKDACVGDSGGPLVVKTPVGSNGSFRWTLAGITSAGFGCAQSRQPGIYHRVSHTVDWILDNLD